jgi:hypothetical protein
MKLRPHGFSRSYKLSFIYFPQRHTGLNWMRKPLRLSRRPVVELKWFLKRFLVSSDWWVSECDSGPVWFMDLDDRTIQHFIFFNPPHASRETTKQASRCYSPPLAVYACYSSGKMPLLFQAPAAQAAKPKSPTFTISGHARQGCPCG